MAAPLERTEQRVIGVLIEKELAVPDVYPLTVPALLAGCNQKNNRDPVTDLREFEVEGALMALRLKDWVRRSERDGGRSLRYRHLAEDRLGVDAREKAVLAELLLRGPQAPGALKTRVERMGFVASPEEVERVLQGLAQKLGGPLVEILPLRPRERDRRWAHLIGPRDPGHEADATPAEDAPAAAATTAPATTASATTVSAPFRASESDLATRLAALEARVAELGARLDRLEGGGPARQPAP